MVKKKLYVLLICVCLSPIVLAQNTKIDSSKMVTLHIDPQSARGAKVSDVFDKVNFIPLETTSESLFGVIGQFEKVDSCFVIYDYDTQAVLVFSKTGKFKAKVNGSKIDQNEQGTTGNNVSGFTLKHEADRTLIRIYSGKYFYHFDLNGKLVNKNLTAEENYDWGVKFSDGTKIVNEQFNKDTVYYGLALMKDTKAVGAYFPYSKFRLKNDDYFSSSINPISDSKISDEMFFVNFFDYNIYKITPTNLYLNYRIIFPKEISLPLDFTVNPIYKKKRRDFLKQRSDIIAGVINVYKAGNNLYFKTLSYSGSLEKKNALIYNLKNNSLISIKDIEPDSSSMYLPVTDAGRFFDFLSHGFYLYDGDYLYTSYSSLAMFSFKEQSSDQSHKYTPLMKHYFETQNRKSNPVLIELKPKKD